MQNASVNQDNQTTLDRTIAEWQGPIYNLAYRMLGNEADAADATQDVFLAVVSRWRRYDPARPLKPWLMQVALNRIRNFHRGEAARGRRERAASRPEGAPQEGASVEDDDLKRRVHDALGCLPPKDRELIVLHYYNGLSHGEMGAALSVPRTTVQSRLGKALERLRGALAGLGCVVTAPALEGAMRATAPIEVPAGLSASLSALPAAAGSASAAASLPVSLGGLIMTKKVLAAAAVVLGCLVVAGGAYSTGRRQGRVEMETVAAAEKASAAASRRAGEELRALIGQLSEELRALRARLEAEAHAALRSSAAADAPASAAGESGETVGGGQDDLALDWSKLSALFAERLDLIYELSVAGRDRQRTKEERRVMAELERALMETLSRARLISDEPFYDSRILLGMCGALCIPALDLSEKQEKDVRAALAKVFAERVEGFDPDSGLPTEAYRVRQNFLRGMDEAVSGSIDEAQAERWRKISALSRRFLEGDRERVTMPSSPEGGAEAREAGVIKNWQRAFSLAEGQSGLFQPIAADFIARADQVRARYGQLDAAPKQLTPAEKANLASEVLDLQIEAEKQLLRHLTPEQREALRGRAPTVLQFAPGDGGGIDRRSGAPL